MKMALAMEERRDRILATGCAGTMNVWRSFVPMLVEVSEKIVSLSRQQSAQVPFLIASSNAVEMMIIPTVLEHTMPTVAPSHRREVDVDQHTIASLRRSVAEKTEENKTLKAALNKKDREIEQLQYKLGLATGKFQLSPSEGGPSEK